MRKKLFGRSRAIAILCAAALAVTSLGAPTYEASAAKKTTSFTRKIVTKSLSKNKDICFIANSINLYIAFALGNQKWKTNQFSAVKKLEIASVAAIGVDGKGFDSKDTLRNGTMYRVKEAAVLTTYKRLFGGTPKIDSIKADNRIFAVKKGKCYVLAGDWGLGIPYAGIDAVVQKGNTTYEIVLSNDFKDDRSKLVYYRQGSSGITIKKTNEGFVVTGIEYVPSHMEAISDETMEKFLPVIKDLKKGEGYAFAKTSNGRDILFIAESTYQYDLDTRAAIAVKVYTIDDHGQVSFSGIAESNGTSYPIGLSKDNQFIFAGGGHCVHKYAINPGQTVLTEVEYGEETFDTSGKASYTLNGQPVANDSELMRLYREWVNHALVIDFIVC